MDGFDVTSNITVNDLNRNDLKEVLRYLNSYYLKYRDFLDLPTNLTFGIEIEYSKVKPRLVDFYVNEILRDWNSIVDWDSKREAALPYGGEVTSPIMIDSDKCWREMKEICHFLKNNGADPLARAGGHIHLGANILANDYSMWRRFFKLYTIFEDILYKVCYGDKINGRTNIAHFAKPVGEILLSKMWRFNYAKDVIDIKEIFPNDTRGYGLNLRHVNFEDINTAPNNTIEFRFPNATIEEVIWQNNINVLTKFLLAVFNRNISEDYLDSLLKDMEYQLYTGRIDYKAIDFKKALLFAD